MGKVSEYYNIISGYISESRMEDLKGFLKANSNLPGPRGNLEMAYAFGDCFDTSATDDMWRFLLELSGINSDEAPTGDPAEILPFCAALAAGSHYVHAEIKRKARIREILRAAMNDKRWRMREAAAMGYQRIAEKDFEAVKGIFDSMYDGSNFLEKRAIIASLAHPPILKNKSIALYSLETGGCIMNEAALLSTELLKSEGFKVLSKGLEYALSVFAAHAPEEGFDMLERFAAFPQKHIKNIIKSNLGKARLKEKFPQKTEKAISMLGV